MTIQLGIIGCGHIVRQVHLRTLRNLPGVRVVALADTDESALSQASARVLGAKVFADYHDLLALPEVEAVLIAVPPALHEAVALAAFARGKPVYLEKPLAHSLESGRNILDAWKASKSIGMIGFNYRFNPLNIEARDLIRAGRIGPVLGARTLFLGLSAHIPQWLRQRDTGGGALLELGSHHFDLIPYLTGKRIQEVAADIRFINSEGDWAAVQLRLEGGALVQCFFAMRQVSDDRLEIYGETGKLLVDRFRSLEAEYYNNRKVARLRRLRHILGSLLRSPLVGDDLLAPLRERSFAGALAHFVQCVRDHQLPDCSLMDGYRSLAVVTTAEEASRSRRTLPVVEYND